MARRHGGYLVEMSAQGPDAWSEPVDDDQSAEQDDTPIDDGGRAGVADTTSPSSGLAAPGPRAPGTEAAPVSARHEQPPQDDEREHPADFASGGYDDRQEDAQPGSDRQTPDEVVDR
jgi:hypothetical protein